MEVNTGTSPKKGSKNGLQMAIRPNYRERLIGEIQVLKSWEELIAASTDDLERWVGLNALLRRNLRHSDDGPGGGTKGAGALIG